MKLAAYRGKFRRDVSGVQPARAKRRCPSAAILAVLVKSLPLVPIGTTPACVGFAAAFGISKAGK
jgi:hypothetical protein